MPDIQRRFSAFTMQSTALVSQLISEAIIQYNGVELSVKKALWDTGATRTCISTAVVQSLSLIPSGKMNILTPSGLKQVNTYAINIMLPNQVGVKDVEVCDSEIEERGLDLLIGMGIILLGDSTVSSYGGRTTFSFRFLSKKETDYVKQIKAENVIGRKYGTGSRKHK